MYRSKCLLGTQTKNGLSYRLYRSHSVTTPSRKLLEKPACLKYKGNNGQLMSTASKGKDTSKSVWLWRALSAGILFVGGGFIFAWRNDSFRKVFKLLNPVEDEHIVVNILDSSSPSQIDFEVGKEHVAVEEGDIVDIPVIPEEEVQTQASEHTEEIPHPQEKEDENVVVINIIDSPPSPSQIDFDVGKEHETAVEEVQKLLKSINRMDLLSKEQKSQILVTAYGNLKIILDDAITTKTSAAGMLQGCFNQIVQALLVTKEDPAYKSIWDASAELEHSIQESIDLVRTKETELNSQVKNIQELIDNIRKDGPTSYIADKTEELISSSNESLIWVESEIASLTSKVNFLHGFQKRLGDSPEKLQNHLNELIPDFIKLLNLKHIDIQNLSHEDALILLSLRRIELIYSEAQEKEKEQKLQSETSLQKQVENVRREANDHVNKIVEKIESDKKDEQNEAVKELNQLNEIRLQEELKTQHEIHQQELSDAKAKQEAELAAQHKTELGSMINEQEERHYFEIRNNLLYLSGIESKITDVLDIDEKVRKNQRLWAAINALSITLNNITDNGRTKELIPEISSIQQCNHNDDILSTIISTFPESAASSGVIPEIALIEDFNNDIKRVCKNVAMVKDESVSVLAYAFSYIKSLFVVSRFYRREIVGEINLETLGPYEILEKAEYYIEQGDLEQAAKFMSQLKGIPRKLCTDWLKEVLLFLETKQSVNLLMAYAVGLNSTVQ